VRTVEQVPQEQSQHCRPFSASESPDQETDAVSRRRKNSLIEKCLKQLVKKGLFGWPYVKDYLYDLKRRNCRPNTILSYFTMLMVFLSDLKERGRTYLETITREDLSSFIEPEPDRGLQPKTINCHLNSIRGFNHYLIEEEQVIIIGDGLWPADDSLSVRPVLFSGHSTP
jgi:hypothetical protein